MASRKSYKKDASTNKYCSHCYPSKCYCSNNSLCNRCESCGYKICRCKSICKCKPKCKGKCEFDLLNIDASKDVTVTQGDLELEIEQGDVSQNNSQGQSGSNLGPQNQTNSQGLSGSNLGPQNQTNSQGQSGSSLGSQTQTPTETQNLTMGEQTQTGPTQTQSGASTQTQSPSQTGATQSQTHTNGAQTTGPQTLQANPTNNSSADVTQTVNGVTVNVPVTLSVSCGCDKKKCDEKIRYKKDACFDCCAKSLANLLNQIRILQPTFLETINIFLTNSPALAVNPVQNQTITNVYDCSTVSFATGPIVSTPSTTAQLCKVAGFSVVNNGATPSLFQFLTNFAATCTTNPSKDTCGCGGNNCIQCNKFLCKCNTCANGIGEQLKLLIGSTNVDLVIDGAPEMIQDVSVLNICDCLAFFVDEASSIIYVFSLCAINEFTPVSTPPLDSPPSAPPETLPPSSRSLFDS